MKLNTSDLRVPDQDFPSIKSRLVTLLRIDDRGVRYATGVIDKRELLRIDGDATYIAVWTGLYRSDAFQVPEALLNRWIVEC
jgi:hypothetical protein